MGIVRVGVASEEHGIRNVCSDIVVWEFEEDPRVETKYKGGFHFEFKRVERKCLGQRVDYCPGINRN
ncbi:hypothetical protein HZH68_005011 [Vespula germanica]|uniref:Uncharacterized protein n=1 Tax=Vespula germanica TaxID=30212 RepID=A0A834KGR6_VESGE|nr:hypothetical protein HZH68_005011 [Vespula germanica]